MAVPEDLREAWVLGILGVVGPLYNPHLYPCFSQASLPVSVFSIPLALENPSCFQFLFFLIPVLLLESFLFYFSKSLLILHSTLSIFLFFCSCSNENVHKEFKKALGANCIFLNITNSELFILVSLFCLKFRLSPFNYFSFSPLNSFVERGAKCVYIYLLEKTLLLLIPVGPGSLPFLCLPHVWP